LGSGERKGVEAWSHYVAQAGLEFMTSANKQSKTN
jgi:hypothetical protein